MFLYARVRFLPPCPMRAVGGVSRLGTCVPVLVRACVCQCGGTFYQRVPMCAPGSLFGSRCWRNLDLGSHPRCREARVARVSSLPEEQKLDNLTTPAGPLLRERPAWGGPGGGVSLEGVKSRGAGGGPGPRAGRGLGNLRG